MRYNIPHHASTGCAGVIRIGPLRIVQVPHIVLDTTFISNKILFIEYEHV